MDTELDRAKVITVPVGYAATGIVKLVHLGRNLIRFVRFMARPALRQLKWNLTMFYHIVIEGRNVVMIEQDKLVQINHYHTRYEGTNRAA